MASFASKPVLHDIDPRIADAWNFDEWRELLSETNRSLKLPGQGDNPTYQILHSVAQSKNATTAAHKHAPLDLLHALFSRGTILTPLQLRLLDWGCDDLVDDWPATLGALRLANARRSAKAAGKDAAKLEVAHEFVVECLSKCLLHWDLDSASKLALLGMATFTDARNRVYQFWRISTLFLYSTSTVHEISAQNRAMFNLLAIKMCEKLWEESRNPQAPPLKHEELLLLLHVIDRFAPTHSIRGEVLGKWQTFRDLASQRHLFMVMAEPPLDSWRSPSQLFDMISEAMQDAEEATAVPGEGCARKLPTFRVSDWSVWKRWIASAKEIRHEHTTAPTHVMDVLHSHLEAQNLQPFYRRTLDLASVEAAFELLPHGHHGMKSKAVKSYIVRYGTHLSCFDDLRPYLTRLNSNNLVKILGGLNEQAGGSKGQTATPHGLDDQAILKVLALKIRYLALTFPSSSSADGDSFESLGGDAFLIHKHYFVQRRPAGARWAMADAVIVRALCLLRQQGICRTVQAALVLEGQLQFQKDEQNGTLLLVLLKTHLLLGNAPRAWELWKHLQVKRTTIDSLGVLFFDRLASIGPAIMLKWQVVQELQGHYKTALKTRMHDKINEAFASQSYMSILGIAEHMNAIWYGFGRVVATVEISKAARALGRKDLAASIPKLDFPDSHKIQATPDLGSFPAWEAAASESPADVLLSLGPRPSSSRAHLNLLTEKFFDVLNTNSKPPPTYKSSASGAAELASVVESLQQIGNSIDHFIHQDRASHAALTDPEHAFFQIIQLLCIIVPRATTTHTANTNPTRFLSQFVDAIVSAIEDLALLDTPDDGNLPAIAIAIHTLHSLPRLSIFREAVNAAQVAGAFIETSTRRDAEFSKKPLGKEMLGHARTLREISTDGAKLVLSDATKRMNEPAAIAQIHKWAGDGFGLDIIKRLVVGWKENLKSWQDVKWE